MDTAQKGELRQIQETNGESRILLVDDHPLLCYALTNLLSNEPNLHVIGECYCAKDALRKIRIDPPHIVITDITLPGGFDGLELIKYIHGEQPDIRILVYSVHEESLYALRAQEAGARGYVMKEKSIQEFIAAAHDIHNGHCAFSKEIIEHNKKQHINTHTHGRESPIQSLSDRELEVLILIGKGESTVQIAWHLGIATKTVETHRVHLREKLAIKSGAELIRYAITWRLSGSL